LKWGNYFKKRRKKTLKWGDCDILDTNFRDGKIGHDPQTRHDMTQN